jgi:hypothetical protein
MASWKTHKCDSCHYSFVGSGKPDALMMGPTIPVVCLKCNEIYDRIIHSPIGEQLNGKCEECGSKKYTEWDYESKKCPQCKDGIIGESEGGVSILAD